MRTWPVCAAEAGKTSPGSCRSSSAAVWSFEKDVATGSGTSLASDRSPAFRLALAVHVGVDLVVPLALDGLDSPERAVLDDRRLLLVVLLAHHDGLLSEMVQAGQLILHRLRGPVTRLRRSDVQVGMTGRGELDGGAVVGDDVG